MAHRRCEPRLALCAAPVRSSGDTPSQAQRAEVRRPQGGTRRVGGRSGEFGSGDPVGERGASAELAARRVGDAGGDQPCGYAEDHRPYDLRPRMDAHGATAGPYTEELKRQQICTFGYDDRRLSHYEEDSTDPVGAGRRSVRSAEPLARAEDLARRLGSGPEERAGVCAQSARLLGASATARGPAGDCDRLDRRLSPLCWTTSLS